MWGCSLLFHNTCLPPKHSWRAFCLLVAHGYHQAWWQGIRERSHRAPHHPLCGMGLGDLIYIEQAAFSCPRVEDI